MILSKYIMIVVRSPTSDIVKATSRHCLLPGWVELQRKAKLWSSRLCNNCICRVALQICSITWSVISQFSQHCWNSSKKEWEGGILVNDSGEGVEKCRDVMSTTVENTAATPQFAWFALRIQKRLSTNVFFQQKKYIYYILCSNQKHRYNRVGG